MQGSQTSGFKNVSSGKIHPILYGDGNGLVYFTFDWQCFCMEFKAAVRQSLLFLYVLKHPIVQNFWFSYWGPKWHLLVQETVLGQCGPLLHYLQSNQKSQCWHALHHQWLFKQCQICKQRICGPCDLVSTLWLVRFAFFKLLGTLSFLTAPFGPASHM